MLFAQAEPANQWVAAGETVLRHAEAQPNTTFALLAIVGPVLVGFAFIFAGVKWGLPFVREQLEAFRAHTANMLSQRNADASQDLAAARDLAKSQHSAIVEKIGDEVSRHTGELAKLNEKSERHGELLRSVAVKVGAVVLVLVLAAAFKHAMHRVLTVEACRCDPPCAAGQRCTCDGCKEIKTTTVLQPRSALALNSFPNVAGYSCASRSVACF